MSGKINWDKIVMAFIEPDDDAMAVIWKVGGALGALAGVILGFGAGGLGGAVLGLILGSIVGAIALFSVMMIIGRGTIFLLVAAIIASPFLLIYALWGVGK